MRTSPVFSPSPTCNGLPLFSHICTNLDHVFPGAASLALFPRLFARVHLQAVDRDFFS